MGQWCYAALPKITIQDDLSLLAVTTKLMYLGGFWVFGKKKNLPSLKKQDWNGQEKNMNKKYGKNIVLLLTYRIQFALIIFGKKIYV